MAEQTCRTKMSLGIPDKQKVKELENSSSLVPDEEWKVGHAAAMEL